MQNIQAKWMMAATAAVILAAGSARGKAQAQAHFGWGQRVVGTWSTSGGSSLQGVAVDANGNVFVTDSGTSTVSEIVAVNGVLPSQPRILPVGSGFNAPSSVAVDANGDVFVADTGNNQVKEIVAVNHTVPASPTILTLAPAYSFSQPKAITVDLKGNVFVADSNAPYLLEIEAVGGSIPANPTVLTVRPSSASKMAFHSATGLAVDQYGDVFAADVWDEQTYEFLAVNGTMPANPNVLQVSGITASGAVAPIAVAVDASGDVFVSNDGEIEIGEFVAVQGTIPKTAPLVAVGFVPQGASGVQETSGIAVDAHGNVFFANPAQGTVTELSTEAVNFGALPVASATRPTLPVTFIFDQGGTLGAAPKVATEGILGLDFTDAGTGTCTTNGTAYVYNAGDSCTVNVRFAPLAAGLRRGAITMTNADGAIMAEGYVEGAGIAPQIEYLPGVQQVVAVGSPSLTGMAVDAAGNVYFADSQNKEIKIESPANGGYTVKWAQSTSWTPVGLALSGAGDFFVTDTTGNRVVKETFTGGGYSATTAVSGLKDPQAVAVDMAGRLYIADTGNNRVLVEAPSGQSYSQVAVLNSIVSPSSLALDGSGNLYVTIGSGDAIVQSFDGGLYRYHTLLAQDLGKSSGIAVDLNGNVFIADNSHGQVLEESPYSNGTYTQSVWLSGLSAPGSLALDKAGNLYIAETGKERLLKEDYSDSPTLTFAPTTQYTLTLGDQQVEWVANMGNAALKFSSASFPSDFPGSTICGTANYANLQPGTGCPLQVEFYPKAAMGAGPSATLTEPVTITTNNLNVTNAVSGLTVTGVELKPVTVTLGVNWTTTTTTVPVTATVTVSGGSGTPAGTIQFQIDGLSKGSPVTLASGKATAAIAIPVGTHVLTAVYSGSSSYPAKTSSGATIHSNAAKTAASVSLTAPPTVVTKKSFTITTAIAESLAGVMPTGTVKVYMAAGSATATLEATLTVNSSGQASWTTTAGAVGSYKVYSVYSGDQNYTGATTSTQTISVTAN